MTAPPLVAVLLGTDHHPFPRLLGWVQELAAELDVLWFVQHGGTDLPWGLSGAEMLSAPELQALLRRADAVVTHGGPGLVMEARDAGHRPVVVARDPLLGEHVDGHQQRFVGRIADSGLVVSAPTRTVLHHELALALARGRGEARSETSDASAARFGRLVDELLGRHSTPLSS